MANSNPNPATRFKPGQSGNPAGRAKAEGEVRALAQEHGPAALQRLVDLMRSRNERVAVAAAQAVLDRGYGKAPQQVAIDATFRQADVSSEPLTQEEWLRTYGAPAEPAKVN